MSAADHAAHMMTPVPAPASASTSVLGMDGSPIGTLSAVQGTKGVLIRVEIEAGGLTEGWHGIHLHAVGDCSDTGTYKLSGGHEGMMEGGHGLLNPAGPEEGDLPNIWAGADGSAKYEAYSSLFELAPALDDDGLALIIHASPDDHTTQPIGGAGARVACGAMN
jgi:Cu-Zn family superoxide dismutase